MAATFLKVAWDTCNKRILTWCLMQQKRVQTCVSNNSRKKNKNKRKHIIKKRKLTGDEKIGILGIGGKGGSDIIGVGNAGYKIQDYKMKVHG
jgi:hypothetical protein